MGLGGKGMMWWDALMVVWVEGSVEGESRSE